MAVTRKANATYVIPTENESYKAAYYDPNKGGLGVGGYWLYPTKSNTAPSNVLSSTGTNNANFFNNSHTVDHSPYTTDVGYFAGSPSAYGTFDQGGDVWNWNETAVTSSSRGLRGGGWDNSSYHLASSYRNHDYPTYESFGFGFRVASVPEPSSLLTTAMIAVTGLLYFWRKHA
jgi:formylglycine-generating enzyme required for sulfatase activity